MLTTIIQKFTRTSPPDMATHEATELLASCSLPDPDDLRRQLAAFESQLAADDGRWEALDRTSNPRAFLEQQAIAERRERLLSQIDALKSQVAVAEKRRAAFVALVEMLSTIDQQIAQTSQRLYADVLITSKDERCAGLALLDGLVRVRARIAAPLALVSALRKFRRAPDPLGALADDLRARADEIDRQRAPGMRGSAFAALPDGASELIAALNEGRSA
jgi:hypothetical protein